MVKGEDEVPIDMSQFDWIKLKEDMDAVSGQKQVPTAKAYWQKMEENPLVPFGFLMTVSALGFGLHAMSKGQKNLSQLMMRCRVAAQGFTFIALVTGVLLSNRFKK